MKRGHKHTKSAKAFWNKEYAGGDHLALSQKHSEDLERFLRWLPRQKDADWYGPLEAALDIGCGNGRNLIYLAREYGLSGTGFDISEEAIAQAKTQATDLPLTFLVHSIEEPLPLPDHSVNLVLDMMTSHFLDEAGRARLRAEIVRVLKPGGWLFFKTFLLDDDLNAKKLLHDHPADEPGSYIHPKIGKLEHVATEVEVRETLSEHFDVRRITKSFKHRTRSGGAGKRRSICAYAQKIDQ